VTGAWPAQGIPLQGQQGIIGPIGPTGPTGANGNTLLNGTGAPANTLGNNGDFYLDTAANMMYGPKTGGAWPAGFSIIGPAGPPGPISGNFPDAPSDSNLYGRKNAVWSLIPSTAGVAVGTTAPATPADNTLWWKSDVGVMYIYYNDGNTKQWVVVDPTIDPGSYVVKAGDTMLGPLTLAADPTTNLQAATKQYIDNRALRYDAAQGLTALQQSQARRNVAFTAANRNHIAGLGLSTAGASATFTVNPGAAADSTNAQMMLLAAAMSKTTAAFAVGSGNGALDTGSIVANTWYHVYLVMNASTMAIDVMVSGSLTPALSGGFSLFRRIGSMKTNASSQWASFSQLDDEFLWLVPIQDVANVTLTSTALLSTLSTPPGVQTFADVLFASNPGATVYFTVTSPDQTDSVPSASIFDTYSLSNTAPAFWHGYIRTDINSRIRVRPSITAGACYINTRGWRDPRGRNA
jgi:hypothetical protein